MIEAGELGEGVGGGGAGGWARAAEVGWGGGQQQMAGIQAKDIQETRVG